MSLDQSLTNASGVEIIAPMTNPPRPLSVRDVVLGVLSTTGPGESANDPDIVGLAAMVTAGTFTPSAAQRGKLVERLERYQPPYTVAQIKTALNLE